MYYHIILKNIYTVMKKLSNYLVRKTLNISELTIAVSLNAKKNYKHE